MISFDEMWGKLEKYLKVEKALECGFSNGKYTKILAKYAKDVVGIDVSEDFLKIAEQNLKDCCNIKLMIMSADNMQFFDKSFDVILNTSFHEFDLSKDTYSVDLELKKTILKEMIRVSNCIIFVEPTEEAVTNKLFRVFNPNEDHSDRIFQSNKLIDDFMKENNYSLVLSGKTYNEDKFETREELENEMLVWWSDIKIPSSDSERKQMIKQIDEVLEDCGMLEKLHVIEEICFKVYERVK